MDGTKQLIALLAACLATGCRTASMPAPAFAAALPPGIEATFSAPATVRQGDSLVMTLKVRNASSDVVMLDLYAQGNWSFDPIVRDDKGSVLWERGVGSGVFMSGGLAIGLPPRGEHQFTATWPGVAVPSTGSRVVHVTPRLLGPRGTPIWTGKVVAITVRD